MLPHIKKNSTMQLNLVTGFVVLISIGALVMSAIVFARQEEMRKKDPTLLGGRSEGGSC